MPLVEIKDFNILTENNPDFDQPVKDNQETYEKLVKMQTKYDYDDDYYRKDDDYYRKFIRFFISSK